MTAAVSHSGIWQNVQRTTQVTTDVLTDTDGAAKTASFVRSVLAIAGALSPLSPGLIEFNKTVKTFETVANVVDTVKRGNGVVKLTDTPKKPRHWSEVAVTISGFVSRFFGVITFLDQTKLIQLGSVYAAIGAIPVIGAVFIALPVLAIISLATFTFNSINQSREHYFWKKSIALYEANPGQVNWNAHLTLKHYSIKTAEDYRWAMIDRSKASFSIASDVSKIALITLGIVATFTGVAFLSITSPLMLGLGVVVASLGLYKVIYDKSVGKREKEKTPVSEPVPLVQPAPLSIPENSLTV